MKRILASGAAVLVGAVLSSCTFSGINSMPLPFAAGGGDDAITATVMLENATNLVPNSEVKYRELTIGSVRKIELEDWTATLTIGIEADAKIPDDVTASIAQKSLLGAEYLELKDPDDRPAEVNNVHLLADGATIGLDRTDRYPETEEVLSAASLLLNGGGLPQIQSISHELNAALGGRHKDIRSLIKRVGTTSAALHDQQDSIVDALQGIKNLSATVNRNGKAVRRALADLPAGLEVLDLAEPELASALAALGSISGPTTRGLRPNAEKLAEILENLKPVLEAIADFGPDVVATLENITYPFPATIAEEFSRGGHANVYANIKVSAPQLAQDWLGVSSLDVLYGELAGNTPLGTVDDAIDPLTDILKGAGVAGDEEAGSDDKNDQGSGGSEGGSPESPGSNGLSDLLGALLGGKS